MKLGIDLGTYNSSAAFALDKDKVIMVESSQGGTKYGKRFPSFVLFDHNGVKQAVGEAAKRELGVKPGLVVWGAKRLVGLSYQEAVKTGELQHFNYPVEEGPGGSILIRVGGRTFRPENILQFIFEEIRRDAQNERLNKELRGASIDEAVVTVPAYYKAWRTTPIVDAARGAGFRKVETIAEPTAAALRYGLAIDKETTILAFDMGAGTLDVTLLQSLRVGDDLISGELCTTGNEGFGGLNMDTLLAAKWGAHFGVAADLNAQARFRGHVEMAKMQLSKSERANLELPDGDVVEVTRADLESVLKPILDEKCRGPIRTALKLAQRSAREIDHLLFVGGPAHMPCLRQIVYDELRELGATRSLLREIEAINEKGFSVNPMDCVSQGASLKAGEFIVPSKKTLAEGYGTLLGPYYVPLITHGADYPTQELKPFPITGLDLHAKRVPISLVSKRPKDLRSAREEIEFDYTHLGDFSIAVNPTGELPSVGILLAVDGNKIASARLTDLRGTSGTVTYLRFETITGVPIQPQEGRPKDLSTQDLQVIKETAGPLTLRPWTVEQLERLARAVRSLVDQPTMQCVSSEAREEALCLREQLERLVASGNTSGCAKLWCQAQSLLSRLFGEGLLDDQEWRTMKDHFDQIADLTG